MGKYRVRLAVDSERGSMVVVALKARDAARSGMGARWVRRVLAAFALIMSCTALALGGLWLGLRLSTPGDLWLGARDCQLSGAAVVPRRN